MLGEVLKRLGNLHRLLWMDRRMSLVELQLERLRHRAATLRKRTEHHMELMDALKSSLEVPPELVEEFHEWKEHNPIPERPLVSVIVATYNRARPLIERCVPSVLGQTYDNLELIVVGDCCTDETEELLAAIDDPRLIFINLPQRSTYPEDPERRWMVAGTPPRNRGLAAARGEFITYLDDDDEYALDRLEKLVKFASEEGCDLVWHPFWLETPTGEWIVVEAEKFAYPQISTASVFYRSWFKKIPWNLEAHWLLEPDDWNLLRRIKYVNPASRRYPEPLFNHYQEASPDRPLNAIRTQWTG